MTADRRFRRRERLRLRNDFAHVYTRRCRAGDGKLLVYVARNDLDLSRLGMSVSRRAGNAVRRNRIRRRLREAFRLSRASIPQGLDIICVAGAATAHGDYDMALALTTLVKKAAQRLESTDG